MDSDTSKSRRNSKEGGDYSDSNSYTTATAGRRGSLSEQQMRDLRQIFDWLDHTGDGEITAHELLVALSAMSSNATLESAEALIRDATGSSKATLSWIEFCNVIQDGMKVGDSSTATAAQMFELLDTKGSGLLSPNVLRAALKRWGCDASDHSLDKMVRYIDEDRDGQVSLQEFIDALGKRSW